MSNKEQSPPLKSSGLGAFWAELRERKVVRVGIAYLVVGLAIMEGGDIVLGNLGAPQWMVTALILLVIAGFPIALVASWVYELTPMGIRLTDTEMREGGGSVGTDSIRRHNVVWLFVGATVPTLIFGSLALVFYLRSSPVPLDSSPGAGQVEDVDRSIAVLPFTYIGSDPERAHFPVAIQNTLIANLQKVDGLDGVAPAAATEVFKGSNAPLSSIADELDVAHLITGSVQPVGDEMLILIDLIRPGQTDPLWSGEFQRTLGMDNFLSLQREVTEEIAKELQAVLSPEVVADIEERPTENEEAYDLFLQSQALDRYAVEQRIELLERATRLDPDFEKAWVGIASSFLNWAWIRDQDNPAILESVNRAFEELERLQPRVDVLVLKSDMQKVVYNDLDGAIELLLEARRLDPNHAGVLRQLGRRYLDKGDFEQAELFLKLSHEQAPFANVTPGFLNYAYVLQQKWNEAGIWIDQVIQSGRFRKDYPYPYFVKAENNYLWTGDLAIFAASLEALPQEPDNLRISADPQLLRRELDEAMRILKTDNQVMPKVFLATPTFVNGLEVREQEILMALIAFGLGRSDEQRVFAYQALGEQIKAFENNPNADPDQGANLAICYALVGDREQMEEAIARTREKALLPDNQFRFQKLCEGLISMAYLVLGEKDKAIEVLETANDLDGPFYLNRELNAWFIFDRLKGNPRFEALLSGEDLGPIIEEVTVDEAPEKSIAVLPFANRSNREDDLFFTDGFHEELISHISKIRDITTIARTSVMGYRDTTQRMPEIGKDLNVRYLIEGGVQRGGDQIRIIVNLIDAATEEPIWNERYTREMSAENVFEIQSEICRSIAGALKAVLSPKEEQHIDKVPTENMAALEAYFMGKNEPYTRTGIEKAAEYFREAISLDPNFALAYAALARSQNELGPRAGRREYFVEAEKNVHKALELDASLSEAYIILASIKLRQGNSEASLDASRRAIQINPNDAWANWRWGSNLATLIGDASEGARYLRKSYELDPKTFRSQRALSSSLNLSGNKEESLKVLEKVAAENPMTEMVFFYLGGKYTTLGRFDESIIAFRRKVAFDPTALASIMLIGEQYFSLGDKDMAFWWRDKSSSERLQENPYDTIRLSIFLGDESLRRRAALEQFQINPKYAIEHLLDFDIADGNLEEAMARVEQAFPELLDKEVEIKAYNLEEAIQVARLLMWTGEESHAMQLLDKVLVRLGLMHHDYENEAFRSVAYALLGDEANTQAAIRRFFELGGSPYDLELKQELKPFFDRPEYNAMAEKRKAELAIQLDRIRNMEAAGQLAKIPEHLRD